MPYADLHLHTTHSDGAQPPATMVARAVELGVSAMAITDHDTTSGVAEAREAALQAGLLFFAGVEISAQYHDVEVHVLGYGVGVDHPHLVQTLAGLRDGRRQRIERMVALLADCGVDVREQLAAIEAGPTIGRMHLAKAIHALGTVATVQEAFDRFLNPGRPAFAPLAAAPAAEAVDVIHAAGGLAFIAHPGLRRHTRRLVPELLTLPFDGLEAYHTSHSPGRTEEYVQLARERGLLVCGGSDCHGGIKGQWEMGRVQMPLQHAEAIARRLADGPGAS
jgi:predicted metal-dependent phosphoesterase TrpH